MTKRSTMLDVGQTLRSLGLRDKTSLGLYQGQVGSMLLGGAALQLTDFARKVPEEVGALFAPILPPVIWCGNGCPPYDNRECLHAVLYVLVSGIGWQMWPKGFPSYKTVQRRVKVWLHQDAFRRAWQHLAQRYETLHGINWDEVLLDGSKKPAKKGASRPAPAPWIGLSVGPHCI